MLPPKERVPASYPPSPRRSRDHLFQDLAQKAPEARSSRIGAAILRQWEVSGRDFRPDRQISLPAVVPTPTQWSKARRAREVSGEARETENPKPSPAVVPADIIGLSGSSRPGTGSLWQGD
jgi:hypothetical protein